MDTLYKQFLASPGFPFHQHGDRGAAELPRPGQGFPKGWAIPDEALEGVAGHEPLIHKLKTRWMSRTRWNLTISSSFSPFTSTDRRLQKKSEPPVLTNPSRNGLPSPYSSRTSSGVAGMLAFLPARGPSQSIWFSAMVLARMTHPSLSKTRIPSLEQLMMVLRRWFHVFSRMPSSRIFLAEESASNTSSGCETIWT